MAWIRAQQWGQSLRKIQARQLKRSISVHSLRDQLLATSSIRGSLSTAVYLCQMHDQMHDQRPIQEPDPLQVIEEQGIPISRNTIYCLLVDYTKKKDLEGARRVQSSIVHNGFDSVTVLGDHLIRLFSSCGSLLEANQEFCKLVRPSEHSWNAVISAHGKCGEGARSIELYHTMQLSEKINKFVHIAVLKASVMTFALMEGRLIHSSVNSGLQIDGIIGNILVDMYAKCGSFEEALDVFDELPDRDVISWSAIIGGYAEHGLALPALELFASMVQEKIKPDDVSFLSILKACSNIGAIAYGRLSHTQIIQCGIKCHGVIGNTLVDMYAKCGMLEEAHQMFDALAKRDVVSWGAIIGGYAHQGCGFLALECYEKMLTEGIKPQNITLLSVLKACATIADIDQGRLVHEKIIGHEFDGDVLIGGALVNMYAKCGNLEEARRLFDKLQCRNPEAWGAMLAGYAQFGHGFCALELFEQMQQNGVKPQKTAYLSVLKACTDIFAIDHGRLIHHKIIGCGLESDILVANTLIDMYTKCGSLEEGRKLFKILPKRDVVSWASMIAGYSRNGEIIHALELYNDMQLEGFKLDVVGFLSILKACGVVGAIEQGNLIHNEIIGRGLEANVIIGNALIDMYAKSGRIDMACEVFERLMTHDVVSWDGIIQGYARRGNVNLAWQCLEDMQRQGVKPDTVTFTSILAACSHVGLVEDGYRYFKDMIEKHGIQPTMSHYNCMLDLLGRAGHLKEAKCLLKTIESSIIGWKSLLTACRTYGNVQLGRKCFDQLVELEPHDAATYVVMTNIYSDAQMLNDADRIEELRKRVGAWKKPGKAWIEVNNQVHEFAVGDRSHPQSDEIYAMLKKLSKRMNREGYVPQLSLVSQKMSDMDKEDALCGHCEKLAIAFGLLSTPGGTTIRATKNLRVCSDCHNATKIISKIERREIVIRDVYRIHHFREGACSCEDYV